MGHLIRKIPLSSSAFGFSRTTRRTSLSLEKHTRWNIGESNINMSCVKAHITVRWIKLLRVSHSMARLYPMRFRVVLIEAGVKVYILAIKIFGQINTVSTRKLRTCVKSTMGSITPRGLLATLGSSRLSSAVSKNPPLVITDELGLSLVIICVCY